MSEGVDALRTYTGNFGVIKWHSLCKTERQEKGELLQMVTAGTFDKVIIDTVEVIAYNQQKN